MKGRGKGFMIFGMHLSPGRVCNRASKGCLASCLNTSGHGAYRTTQESRARKTKFFWDNPTAFLAQLCDEIAKAIKHAKKKGFKPAFRLNLTSDIPWEVYGIPQLFPDIQFYDYTKYHDRHPTSNYHLTFSRSESLLNHGQAKHWLDRGGNVAVVFKKELPNTFWGTLVYSGDEDDLRFLDPKNVVVGLKAKGKARKDASGFVV